MPEYSIFFIHLQLIKLGYKGGDPVNWTKVSNEALNTISEFMEVFNFDDMLHGTGKKGVFTENLAYKRMRNITSPSSSSSRDRHGP